LSEQQISRDIPNVLEDALKDSGGNLTQDCWLHRQSGKYVVKHYALERVAAHMKMKFDPPQVIESNVEGRGAVVCVTGYLGDRSDWSIGEAAPYNNQMNYPYAMAEKRAKDRVILKLLNIHGEVYSQEEADDFDETKSKIAKSKESNSKLEEENKALKKQVETQTKHIEKLKNHIQAVFDYHSSILAVKEGIATGNLSEAAEEWWNLGSDQDSTQEIQQLLWVAQAHGGILTTREREVIKTTEFKEAYFGGSDE